MKPSCGVELGKSGLRRKMFFGISLVACVASLTVAQQARGQSKIIVSTPGKPNFPESLTITSFTGAKPHKVLETDLIAFTPAAGDVANAAAKATFLAGQISLQAANASAAATAYVVIVTPVAGSQFQKISFKPGHSGEVLRLNPGPAYGDPPPIEFGLTLDGTSSGSGYAPAELDIIDESSSTTNIFTDDTTGKSASTVLADFATMINGSSGMSMSATVAGDQLLIDGAITSCEFSASDDDPDFTLEYSAAAVPEPGTLLLTGLGLVGIALAHRRRWS